MIRHSFKETYRIMFQYARNEVKHRTHPAGSAFMAAERAMDAYIENFSYDTREDFHRIEEVSKAVLWAIHWTLFKPLHDLKLWQSERRMNFVLEPADSGRESKVWFPGPRLPG